MEGAPKILHTWRLDSFGRAPTWRVSHLKPGSSERQVFGTEPTSAVAPIIGTAELRMPNLASDQSHSKRMIEYHCTPPIWDPKMFRSDAYEDKATTHAGRVKLAEDNHRDQCKTNLQLAKIQTNDV